MNAINPNYVDFDMDPDNIFANTEAAPLHFPQQILVTGFTGSLGTVLVKRLLEAGHWVTGYSRDELKQAQYFKHDRLNMYVGDVRDRDRLIEASRGKNIIFHLAALKRVESLEENPEEAVKTNIEGTDNVLHAQRVNRISRVVLSSTDKACYPVNIYGVTKAAAERLVLRNPNNVVCRYGNVIGSRGSVVPMFVRSLERDRMVEITDRRMTRFWWPLEDAAGFVEHCGLRSNGGLFIPPLQASTVVDMAAAVAECIGVTDYKVKDIGLRPGEKLHETMRTSQEGQLFSSDQTEHHFAPSHLKHMVQKVIGGCR